MWDQGLSKVEESILTESDCQSQVANDVEHEIETLGTKRKRLGYFKNLWSSWRKIVAVGCLCNIVVLIFNLTLLIWAILESEGTFPNYTL